MGTMLTHETIQGIEALADGLSKAQVHEGNDGPKVLLSITTRDTLVHSLRQLLATHQPPPPAIEGIHDTPFRLQVLGALANKLHTLAVTHRAQGNSLSAETMDHAASAILELCQVPPKSEAERFYADSIAKLRQEMDPLDTEPPELEKAIAFAKRWLPEALPANALGQVHFARALAESLIESAEKHLRIEAVGREITGKGRA